MIQVLKISNEIRQLLETEQKRKLKGYKIYIRLNLEVDIYLIEAQVSLQKILLEQYDAYQINFHFLSNESLSSEYSYLKSDFESNHPIDYGLRYRFNTLLEKNSGSGVGTNSNFSVPIITFYSYKGGMGRTTTTTSYALDLVLNHKKKVCIIDCDFEAPGYLNFFNLSHNESIASGEKNGVVEFLVDYGFKKQINIHDYIISPDCKDTGFTELKDKALKNLYVMPAGNLSDTTILETANSYLTHRDQYLEGLARLDFANEQVILEGFTAIFEELQKSIKPDVILIDSRTGFNDVFGVTALMLSNLIVGFFGSSEQTKPGLRFLLDKYYELNASGNNKTELLLVNSILPTDNFQNESFHNTFVTEVGQYIQLIQEKKFSSQSPKDEASLPIFYKLSRNKVLEQLGIKNGNTVEQDFAQHVRLIKGKTFADFSGIFGAINESNGLSKIFISPKSTDNVVKKRQLKNLIIKHLRAILRNDSGNPTLFAEDADINPATFFYRDQMKQLFDKDKFLIQGFKGTGKTYLYKALRDPGLTVVKKELLRQANKSNTIDYIFIDIISLKGKGEPKSFDFSQIDLSEVANKAYYFKNFWLVYTWNSVFLDAEIKLNYNKRSQLHEYVKPFKTSIEAKKRFDSLIADQDKLEIIENDLVELDDYLHANKKFTFVLYDQLDNLIKPNDWREIVSPLIDYWWDYLNRFKSIASKIFIRTDLYNRLTGTNTTRLQNNIINIEWSREEVYAYFFKLVFADSKSKAALFEFMDLISYDKAFIANTKKYLEKHNNQLKLLQNEIEPFMTSFFGKEVLTPSGRLLGKSFDWFYFNLTNADQQSISLRPFINLINGAIDAALQDTSKKIDEIIHQKYYASRENRDYGVKQHFEDLIREDFNRDLGYIFQYLKEKGSAYKKIFLYKSELQALLDEVLIYYSQDLESKNVDELRGILVANGIIHENVKPGENIFYFAQLYKYWLGLSSRKYELKRK
jgi:cellulose biosynthesis protein BcsQ